MKIEIAPRDYQIYCKSYDEATMYLMFLEIVRNPKRVIPVRDL